MKQLKILLQLIRLKLVYIAILLVFVLLTIENVTYSVVLIPYLIVLYRVDRRLLFLSLFTIGVYLGSYLIFINNELPIKENYEITIQSSKKFDSYTTAEGKIGLHRVKISINSEVDFKPGTTIKAIGVVNEIDNQTIPGNFNYKTYLLSKGIKKNITIYEYEITENHFTLKVIPYTISNYIDEKMPLSKAYIKTFILADKSDFDQSFKNDISTLGLSHLFAVSGMHVSLIVIALIYLLKKLQINDRHINMVIVVFLLFFTLLTSFSSSVIRAVLMYLLILINKRYKLEFSSLDILSMIFIVLLIVNPVIYYNLGFTLSFLVTLSILLSSKILKAHSKTTQLFFIGLIAMIMTLPITSSFSHSINFLSIFVNVYFVYIVTFIILPFTFLTFFLPVFDALLFNVTILFERSITILSNVNLLMVRVSFQTPIHVIGYYFSAVLLLIHLEKKQHVWKYVLAHMSLIIFISCSSMFSPFKSVNFIDVYGDSTLIIDSFDRCNIVIDTGDVDNYDNVVNYIKSKNIRRIDYLIITHNHSDHYGEFDDIVKSFDVKHIITNANVSNLISDDFKCGSVLLHYFESTKLLADENNKSVVLTLNISNTTYLFTGDIEVDRENELLLYGFPRIDYLKVPHHGSNTSSTIDFLKHVKPENAVIIVSRKNRHNHPNTEVILRYKTLNIPVERTDQLGTISHRYIFGKEFKRYHQP